MCIKRFNEVIYIISSKQFSVDGLQLVQREINTIIHNQLYDFMLPNKVKEMIDNLTPLFIKMKDLKLPTKAEAKRTELLRQGREIIGNLKQYVNVEYGKEEYVEVYTLQYKRLVAEYLKSKNDMNITQAADLLNRGKKLKKECENTIDGGINHKSFNGMLVELKKYISMSLSA